MMNNMNLPPNLNLSLNNYPDIIDYDQSIHPRNYKDCPYRGKSVGGHSPRSLESVFLSFLWVHGIGRYDYSNVDYRGTMKKVDIVCMIDGHSFSQTPNKHLSGRGCVKCSNLSTGNSKRGTLETALEGIFQAHPENKQLYDYSNAVYINSTVPIKITCTEGHAFFQLIASQRNGIGCPHCFNLRRETRKLENLPDHIRQKTHYLYWVRFTRKKDGLIFDKIGIHQHPNLSVRFGTKEYSGYEREDLFIMQSSYINVVKKEETIKREIWQLYKTSGKFYNIIGQFTGATECFFIEDYDPSTHLIEDGS